MKDFISGTQSRIGGATRNIAVIGWLVKSGVQVEESNQSNLTPWTQGRDIRGEPERDARKVAFPFRESSGAMREDILPVPPRRRIVLFEGIAILL